MSNGVAGRAKLPAQFSAQLSVGSGNDDGQGKNEGISI